VTDARVPTLDDSEWEEEFDAFFRRVSASLVGQAYALGGDLPVAQDLAQEALTRAWSRWGRVRALDDPDAWARHVLHNLAIGDWRRRQSRYRRVTPERDAPAPDLEAVALAAALSALPERQRRAIVLHDAAGVPVRAVAAELGVPEGTVRSWLSRGRALLAEQLHVDDGAGEEVERT
jgi:RNA polymerase sigma-70 factor (ECF subfamily)